MLHKSDYDYSGWTAADLVTRFGSIPVTRICTDPAPGTAREEDVVELHGRSNRLFELVDGTLLEKTMGTYESYVAMRIAAMLFMFVESHDRGIVLGADGMLCFSPGLIRIPDVSYISRERLPNGSNPHQPVASVVPDLVVEVISPGNTDKEMNDKLADYFGFGVRCAWYVYPSERSIHVYTSSDRHSVERACVTGGEVLPGFEMSVDAVLSR